MCRKSTSIIVFVCLALGSLASAAQLNWTGTAGTTDWFNSGNWNDGAGPVPAFIPNDRACIEAKAPTPIVTADACTGSLEIHPWSWAEAPVDCNFTIEAGRFDCNVIYLTGSSTNYYGPGWSDTPGVFYMNGGLAVINDAVAAYANESSPPGAPGGRGLWIGGDSTSWGTRWSSMIMNGGTIMTPKIALYNGDITLNGGLLYDTNAADVEFTIRTMWDRNKIYINGGTLGIDGDQTTKLNNLVKAGRIIPFNTRGEFNGTDYSNMAVYNATDTNTTISATYKPGCAWNPSPAKYATPVAFYGGITLTWSPGDFAGTGGAPNGHYVFLSTIFNDVNTAGVGTAGTASPAYKGRVDANSITLAEATFAINKTYYWRVDEVNTASTNYKGMVWQFQADHDRPRNPQPADGAGLKMPLILTWTPGAWSTTTHRVYFSSDYTTIKDVASPTGIADRGTVGTPEYPLSSLVPDWVLASNTPYYWRVDEVGAGGSVVKGLTWTINTGGSINIDDFQTYFDDTDLDAVWVAGPAVCSGASGNGQIALVREGELGRYMQFTYNAQGGAACYYSETGLSYATSANWTADGVLASPPLVFEIAYRGFASNAADATYDRMYVAVEDTGGDVQITFNPDPNAQRQGPWTTWAISFDELGSGQAGDADLNSVSDLYLGAGFRCADDYYGGGEGNVMFDNIRLLSSTCVPALGPVADFDGNCIVNWQDVDILASDWLVGDLNYNWTTTQQAPPAPVVWYKFNESTGTVCDDTGTKDANGSTGAYDGTVNSPIALNWVAGGGRDGNNCLYLPPGQLSYISVPTNTLYFVGTSTGTSFSIWADADMTAYDTFKGWSSIFGTHVTDTTSANETLEIHCPSPWGAANAFGPSTQFIKKTPNDGVTADTGGPRPVSEYGGRWNNWIFVHDRTSTPAQMLVYLNGILVADVNSTDDADVSGPLVPQPVSAFWIGARGTNWGMWAGKMDDFQVFDAPLNINQVHYIATDGSGILDIPLVSVANIKSSSPEIVNFGDLALMVDEWMTEKLWP